jgi:hypothetical protein
MALSDRAEAPDHDRERGGRKEGIAHAPDPTQEREGLDRRREPTEPGEHGDDPESEYHRSLAADTRRERAGDEHRKRHHEDVARKEQLDHDVRRPHRPGNLREHGIDYPDAEEGDERRERRREDGRFEGSESIGDRHTD